MITRMFAKGTYLLITEGGYYILVCLGDDENAIAMPAGMIGCDELAKVAREVLIEDYREIVPKDLEASAHHNALTQKLLGQLLDGSCRRFVSKDPIISGRARIKFDVSHQSVGWWNIDTVSPEGEDDYYRFISRNNTWSILFSFCSLREDDILEGDYDRSELGERFKASGVTPADLERGMQSLVPNIWEMVNLLIGEDKIVAFSMFPAIGECQNSLREEAEQHDAQELTNQTEYELEDGDYLQREEQETSGARRYVKISDKKVILVEYHKMINLYTQTLWPEGESLYEIIEAKE